MPSGFFGSSWVVPTVDEVRVPNLQWISTFTADPSTDSLTTSVPHGQVQGEVVMFTSTGNLPAPLQPFTLYRVLSAGQVWIRWGSDTDYWFGNASTDLMTAPRPHGLTAGTQIFFYGPFDPTGDGQPSPLDGTSYYYIASSGLTATQFKVTFNSSGAGPTVDLTTNGSTQLWLFYMGTAPGGSTSLQVAPLSPWHPPPLPAPINITDAGTGVHSLWIRPLEFIGTIEAQTSFLTGEAIGGRGAIYLDDGKRHQYKNVASIPGLPANTDLYTTASQQKPIAKWQVAGSPISGTGSADLWSYAYPAVSEWGLGDLGVLLGGGETYYSICGACAIAGGPPGPGGGGAAGEGEGAATIETPRPTIRIHDPQISSLIRRAQRAVQAIENMSITGEGFSGDIDSGFMFNTEGD